MIKKREIRFSLQENECLRAAGFYGHNVYRAVIKETVKMGINHQKSLALVIASLVFWVFAAGQAFSNEPANLPVKGIEDIIGAKGKVVNEVLQISFGRKDIGQVKGPEGVTFSSDFEIEGDLFFQPLENKKAFLNADVALLEDEVNPFIGALLENGLVFQAFHQHAPTDPQIWFVHFRGTDDPLKLARSVKAALGVTATPFPQQSPQNTSSPLDPKRLANILRGHAETGENGVITVWVYRSDPITIGNTLVNPQANISTNIEFKPTGGDNAEVMSDFAMRAEEVDPVVKLMYNELQWYQGCLYNQETGEQPQLYFDHMIKSGDAYALAREIRRGLDLTQSE